MSFIKYSYSHMHRLHRFNLAVCQSPSIVVSIKPPLGCRLYSRGTDDMDRMRFKWPVDNYMPSSQPFYVFPIVSTADDAKRIVSNMNDLSKQLLLQELRQLEEESTEAKNSSDHVVTVTRSQLYQVFLINCLPFIGFGILDNGIMIIAGEYIDVTIGAVLGISTMAAAALGNLVSDVAGVGSAGYIESFVSKIGIESPDMSLAQLRLKSVRRTVGLGRTIGISIGCLLGMIPLLFYNKKSNADEAKSD